MTTAGRTALDAGFHFIVPVWGREYTTVFTDLLLPTLLAPGNIPALPHPERHVFQIYTTPEDRAAIDASPACARLKRHMRVAFHRVRVHPEQGGNPYFIQSDCYRRAIREADAADQAMVFLTPDLIMADGSLGNLVRIAGTGARTVLATGVRLVKETVGQTLLRQHRSENGAIAIGPRELMRLALPNIHPISRAHFFHDEGHGLHLSNLYWRVGADGLLARCFHLHPFMVYPRVKNAPFTTTVDGDYIETACPDTGDTYVITDSDEFVAFELSAADRRINVLDRARPQIEFVQWVYNKTTARHRRLIGNVIRMHAGATGTPEWQAAEVEAESCIKGLLSHTEAMARARGDALDAAGYYGQQKILSLHFRTPLRDASEARLFLETALPSVLAPGNVPRLANKRACRWQIDAAPDAAAIVAAAPGFAELQEHMPAAIAPLAGAMETRGAVMEYRRRAAAEAGAAGAAAVFIDHDNVFADEAIAVIATIFAMGARALLVPRLPLRRVTALPALRERFWIDGVLSVAARALIRFALEHLDARPVEGGEALLLPPASLAWRVGADALLVHCFDAYPVAVYPRPGSTPAPRVADDPFLGAIGLSDKEVSVVTDASAFMVCGLVDDAAPRAQTGDLAAVARWAAENTGAYRREVFKAAIRFAAQGSPGPLWPAVAARASTAVIEVLAAMKGASHDAAAG